MVAESGAKQQLLNKVAELYEWLDLELRDEGELAGMCDGCGKCCDFEAFDHRLFVTPPELMYLAANIGGENIQPMTRSRCPYNIAGKCTVYEYRLASCRIFCCKGDVDFQSRLSESALEKFKSICTEFKIPYRYSDLATVLENISKL